MLQALLRGLAGLGSQSSGSSVGFVDGEVRRAEKLALYHTPWCGYCLRVRRVIDELGLDIELVDIGVDRAGREALIEARGRTTVPVLRMGFADGSEAWMPESADIVAYLRALAQ